MEPLCKGRDLETPFTGLTKPLSKDEKSDAFIKEYITSRAESFYGIYMQIISWYDGTSL